MQMGFLMMMTNVSREENIAKDLYEDWMEMLCRLAERKTYLTNEERIYSTFRRNIFSDMKDSENNLVRLHNVIRNMIL